MNTIKRFKNALSVLFQVAILGCFLLLSMNCNKGPETSTNDDNNNQQEMTPKEAVASRYDDFEDDISRKSPITTLMDYYDPAFRCNGKDFNYKKNSLEFSLSDYTGVKVTFTNEYKTINKELVRVKEVGSWRGIFTETEGTLLDSWERVLFWSKNSDGVWRNQGNQDADWNWRYVMDQEQDELVYTLPALDGKRLSISRYLPKGNQVTKIPLIMCHGIAANRLTFDLTPQYSLAKYLSDRGFDVWLPEMRGHGRSYFPDSWDAKSYDWMVEDYITKDVPAIIDYVRQQTGSDQVIWIGHSMGGMVIYGHLIHSALEGKDAHVKELITFGSPGYIDFKNTDQLFSPGWIFDYLFSNIDNLLESYPYLFNLDNYSNLLQILSLFGVSENQFLSMIWNPDNMDDDAATKLTYKGAHNICGEEVRAFNAFYKAKSFFTPDGMIIYSDNYNLLSLPMLIINGAGDEIGITSSVKYVFDNASSNDKTFRKYGVSGCEIIVSGENRFESTTNDPYDCGHLDQVVGKVAPDTVYPYVYNWLMERL